MVHALQDVHRLLCPDGILINVHAHPVPNLIEVHTTLTASKIGWLTEKTDFESERSAFNALVQVVADGQYVLEDERDFQYNIHAGDYAELKQYLSDCWESAILPERTSQRIAAAIQGADEPTDLVIIVPTRMTKLRTV
jgi:hypothetical protein